MGSITKELDVIKKWQRGNNMAVKINRSRIGDIAEHKAVSWLFDQGYEVFRNASSVGFADLVIVDKTGEKTLIDVKTLKLDRRYGSYTSFHSRTKAQAKLGVQILKVHPYNYECEFVKHKEES